MIFVYSIHKMDNISSKWIFGGDMGKRLAIDTGGTFTDIIAIDEVTGEMVALKTSSTPKNPSVGLLKSIEKVVGNKDNLSSQLETVLHGSTVATNAVLEHKFDGLGLLVTNGFRHMIEIARQSVPDGYGNSFFGLSLQGWFHFTWFERCLGDFYMMVPK